MDLVKHNLLKEYTRIVLKLSLVKTQNKDFEFTYWSKQTFYVEMNIRLRCMMSLMNTQKKKKNNHTCTLVQINGMRHKDLKMQFLKLN